MSGERRRGPGREQAGSVTDDSAPAIPGKEASGKEILGQENVTRDSSVKDVPANDNRAYSGSAGETIRRWPRQLVNRLGHFSNLGTRELGAQLWATLLHNLPVKLGALLVATVFWFFVSTDGAVTAQRTLRAPLHTEGLSDTQRVVGLPERVTVRLSGPQSRLRTLNPDGLDVVLNLRGVTGSFERSPRVFPPQGITAVGVVPGELIGTVETLARLEVPVKAALLGSPSADTVLTLRAEPADVQIEGAETQVAQVTQVVAPYDPATPSEAAKEVRVYAADAQGEPVPGVAVTPARVSVSAVASAVLSVRTLPLQVTPVTIPGRQVVSASPTQNEVTVVGPESVLAELSAVTATLSETPTPGPGRYTRALTLDLPAGVTALETPQLELHLR